MTPPCEEALENPFYGATCIAFDDRPALFMITTMTILTKGSATV
jgi:hypothetical protein